MLSEGLVEICPGKPRRPRKEKAEYANDGEFLTLFFLPAKTNQIVCMRLVSFLSLNVNAGLC